MRELTAIERDFIKVIWHHHPFPIEEIKRLYIACNSIDKTLIYIDEARKYARSLDHYTDLIEAVNEANK